MSKIDPEFLTQLQAAKGFLVNLTLKTDPKEICGKLVQINERDGVVSIQSKLLFMEYRTLIKFEDIISIQARKRYED